MFKSIILLSCLVVLSIAFSSLTVSGAAVEREFIPILKSEMNKFEDGSYNVEYETGDGTKRQEEATILNAGTDDEELEVKGSYKYINSFGEEVEVTYTAGKNGFVPYSSIINAKISEVAEAAKDLPKDIDTEREKEITRISRQQKGTPESELSLDAFLPPLETPLETPIETPLEGV